MSAQGLAYGFWTNSRIERMKLALKAPNVRHYNSEKPPAANAALCRLLSVHTASSRDARPCKIVRSAVLFEPGLYGHSDRE